jgi:hypothetical protein
LPGRIKLIPRHLEIAINGMQNGQQRTGALSRLMLPHLMINLLMEKVLISLTTAAPIRMIRQQLLQLPMPAISGKRIQFILNFVPLIIMLAGFIQPTKGL